MACKSTVRYPALLDGREGAFGVSFPDLPGIVAMGNTKEEAIMNAGDSLRDYLVEAKINDEPIVPPSETVEVDCMSTLVWVTLNDIS